MRNMQHNDLVNDNMERGDVDGQADRRWAAAAARPRGGALLRSAEAERMPGPFEKPAAASQLRQGWGSLRAEPYRMNA